MRIALAKVVAIFFYFDDIWKRWMRGKNNNLGSDFNL
jgi:hypothetical protein